MEVWVNKKAILHYCNPQHRGHIEHILRNFKRNVPCSISDTLNTDKLFISLTGNVLFGYSVV